MIAAAALALAGPANAREMSPLSLKECLERASAANTGLKVVAFDTAIAREQVEVAKSGYLPRVDVQGGYVAQLEPQSAKFGPLIAQTQDADFPYANLAIYQTLYDFGRTKARVGSARKQRDAAAHAYAGSQQDLFLQVVRAYYGILESEKLVAAARDEVLQMSAHQNTAQALYEQGVVTRNDLLQAEVRVAASRQKVLSEQNGVENGWLQLNYLIGTPDDFRGDLRDEPEGLALAALNQQADFSRRSEIASLKDLVAADEYSVKEAKGNYYPEFFARLAMDYTKNDEVKEQAIYSGTLGLKVNVFDGFATTARVRQAVEARSRDEQRLRDLEARVRLELAGARNDLKVAQARIRVTQKAIAQAEENLRITRDRYQEKVGTATEVVDAQTLLTQTRTDYYQSVFDLQVAGARVRRAVGEL